MNEFEAGHICVAKLLIEAGADVDKPFLCLLWQYDRVAWHRELLLNRITVIEDSRALMPPHLCNIWGLKSPPMQSEISYTTPPFSLLLFLLFSRMMVALGCHGRAELGGAPELLGGPAGARYDTLYLLL